MRLLVVDNFDSFVYNLVQYVGELGVEPVVVRSDVDWSRVEDIVSEGVDGVLVSPGPKTPEDAGISNKVIEELGPKLPTLGVCLGHQCIGSVYGGKIRRAKTLKHGKVSEIEHDGSGVLAGIPSPFSATRYHSLVVDEPSLPDCLRVTARSMDDGEVMALAHKRHPIYGLQFHPESILTGDGKAIVRNFKLMCEGGG